MNDYQNLTWDDIKMMYAETAQLMKYNEQKNKELFTELRKQSAENERKLMKMFAEADRQRKENDQKYEKIRKKNEKQAAKYNEQAAKYEEQAAKYKEEADKRGAALDARLDKLGKYVGGIANSNGDLAEEFFYYTFKRNKTFVNEKFDYVKQNVMYPEDDNSPEIECDIFLFNGKSAAFIEVKYNAKPENVNIDNLGARVEKFKRLCPEYANHNIYLGVAALSFKKGFARILRSNGIATIHQVGKKMVIYDKEVKVF